MSKPKNKGSARQHAKAQPKSGGNLRQSHNLKAPTEKATNNKATNTRKWPASESDDDTGSDEEPKEWHPCKKTKHGHHKVDEEVEESDGVADEPEEVEEDEEEPVDEAGEKVSYCAAVHEVKLT